MANHKHTSRRKFIKGAALLGASGVLVNPDLRGQNIALKQPKAKNLIFLVSDGMSMGTLSLAQHWKLMNKEQPLEWIQLLSRSDVVHALQQTNSYDSPVTDSAAAASAWGGGELVNNGVINISPSGDFNEPIFVQAKKVNKSIGLVSTSRITHATPAGFLANAVSRDDEDAIAEQYLKRNLDVCLGGGLRHFKNNERDLIPAFLDKGHAICHDLKDLKNLTPRDQKVLGLFTDSHFPYRIDRDRLKGNSRLPTLEKLLEVALEQLAANPDGFVLSVEAARVDHAGHDNDAAAILHEQIEFDRCIRIALNFLESNPDTLVIVTTDHGCGGCQLNAHASGYAETRHALERLKHFTVSLEEIAAKAISDGSLDKVYFEKSTGINVSQAKVRSFDAKIDAGIQYPAGTLADHFSEELIKATAIGWTSHQHTAEHVDLAAIGAGSSLIPNYLRNYELNGIMRRALGI